MNRCLLSPAADGFQPRDLKDLIPGSGLSPVMIVVAMMAIYMVLATVMKELTMVLLTFPQLSLWLPSPMR